MFGHTPPALIFILCVYLMLLQKNLQEHQQIQVNNTFVFEI